MRTMLSAVWILVALVAAVMLTGCAGREPLVVTREVKIPVPVACVDREDLPPIVVLETETLQRNRNMFDKAQALLIDLKALQGENVALRALLEGCIKTVPRR